MSGDRPSTAEDTLAALSEAGDTLATRGGRGSPSALEQGSTVGRYVVLARLGAGGMGVVHAAYDPELDRKVALKLVIPEVGGTARHSEGHARLLREAQALAKLNHPHVVSVHDVGSVDDRVWLAMEFVEGCTLGAWAKERPRTWREVLEVMRPAGAGLRAAHAAGLLHRDFKPDNVMIDRQGRVKVMDFGLARAAHGSPDPSTDLGPATDLEVSTQSQELAEGLTRDLTRAGALMGTPAYMAPEQFGRGDLTAAADQFAYCIVLWELLFGERPFAAQGVPALAEAVLAGRLRTPPRGARVPGWLRRVCERGLAVNPDQRHASIDALLDALATGQRRVRIRRVVLVGGALAVGAIGAWGWHAVQQHRVVEACHAEGHELVAAWDAAAHERVRAALLGTGASFAQTTIDRALPRLDVAVAELRDAHAEACLDARIRGVWDEDTLDRSYWCLDERAMELEAIIGLLEQADDEVVQQAVSAAASLTRTEPCRDAELLRRRGDPPSEDRERVREVRAQLSSASASALAGHLDRGVAAAEDALEDAEALGWPPLVASALVTMGRLRSQAGDHAPAVELLQDGYFTATTAGAVEEAGSAAMTLVSVVGSSQARHAESEIWARLAEAELDRLDAGELDLRRATLWSVRAIVLRSRGSYDEAKALHERALAVREEVLGPNHIVVSASLNNLAAVLGSLGEHERAKDDLERALEIVEEVFGPDHPRVAKGLNNLANIHMERGELEEAKPLLERAISISERALGPEHPDVGKPLFNLGMLWLRTGNLEQARPALERSLELAEATYGLEHPTVAEHLQWLGYLEVRNGEPERALVSIERALAIRERVLGPEHSSVGQTLKLLGEARRDIGEPARAREHLVRALAILESNFGADHAMVIGTLHALAETDRALGAHARARSSYERVVAALERKHGPREPFMAVNLVALAELELADGHPAEAIPLAERAVAILEGEASATEELAAARFALARASWDSGEDRVRARALAQQSAQALRGEEHERLAEVEDWLREHVVDR